MAARSNGYSPYFCRAPLGGYPSLGLFVSFFSAWRSVSRAIFRFQGWLVCGCDVMGKVQYRGSWSGCVWFRGLVKRFGFWLGLNIGHCLRIWAGVHWYHIEMEGWFKFKMVYIWFAIYGALPNIDSIQLLTPYYHFCYTCNINPTLQYTKASVKRNKRTP
jgi:hypothetical protein